MPPTPTNIALMSYKSLGSDFSRSARARATDVLNVKDYRVTGDGITDDYDRLQAVLDMAFGPASNPNGLANAHLNKAVFFPQGRYKIRQPLSLTQVVGGHIFGVAPDVCVISRTQGAGNTLVTNDVAYTTIERINFSGGAGNIAIDLDWDGTWAGSNGGGGHKGNVFADMGAGSSATAIRVANGGFGGSDNIFMNVIVGQNTVAGIDLQSATAINNVVHGGGGFSDFGDANTAVYLASAGQFSSISCISMGTSNGSVWDCRFDSNFPCTFFGGRTENFKFVNMSAGLVTIRSMGVTRGADSVPPFVLANITGGTCVIESVATDVASHPATDCITGNGGRLYLRGNHFSTGYRGTYTGTVVEDKSPIY